ncbi:hypothetical protein ACXYRQ_00670 [Mycoplasma sp. 394]
MKNFIKKWIFPFSALTSLVVASCTNNTNNNKEYDEYDLKRFYVYVDEYQRLNDIKKIKENYFYYLWENNKENNGMFQPLFKDKYVFIKSVDELNKLFLDKFNLNYVKKYYQTFKDKVNFDINTLTEEKLKQINKEEFQNIYLNNENINEFFKSKNLLMYETRNQNSQISQYNLVPDYINDDTENLHFWLINLEQIGVKYMAEESSRKSRITMNVKYIDKSKTITANINPSNQQVKDLYEYLPKEISFVFPMSKT